MAATALAHPHASAARMPPNGRAASDADLERRRDIGVHLTGFAPGCEKIGMHDPRRWKTFYARQPGPVVRALLERLGRRPQDVEAHLEANGDLCVTGQAPPEVAGFLSSAPGEPIVLAMVWEGLSLPEWTACRDALIRLGWTPGAQQVEACA
jgi:hypothetical protein